MKRTVILLTTVLLGSTGLSFAASEVAKYEFSSALVSTDTDPTSVAGIFNNVGLDGSSFNLTGGNPLPSIQDIGSDIPDGSPPTPAGTGATTGYFTFTITPAPGVTLDYSTLSFDVAALAPGTIGNSFVVSLQTGLNSFQNLASTTITGNTSFQNVQYDLSSLAASSSATEFRLVICDNTVSAVNGIAIDNVSLTANVTIAPIPEPATWMLMALGLMIGAQRLRRQVYHKRRAESRSY